VVDHRKRPLSLDVPCGAEVAARGNLSTCREGPRREVQAVEPLAAGRSPPAWRSSPSCRDCSSEEDAAARVAQSYFEDKLAISDSSVLAVNVGGAKECAAVAVRAPDGRERRVILMSDSVLTDGWKPIRLSKRFRSDYLDEGNVLYGLANVHRR